MFGINTAEFLIILVVALIVVGPDKLPDIMRSVGKGLAELRRMSMDVKRTIETEMDRIDEKKRVEEAKKELFPEDEVNEMTAEAAEKSQAQGAEPASADAVPQAQAEEVKPEPTQTAAAPEAQAKASQA